MMVRTMDQQRPLLQGAPDNTSSTSRPGPRPFRRARLSSRLEPIHEALHRGARRGWREGPVFTSGKTFGRRC